MDMFYSSGKRSYCVLENIGLKSFRLLNHCYDQTGTTLCCMNQKAQLQHQLSVSNL